MPRSQTHIGKYTAEFVGTFALVFLGCGACIAHHRYSSDITHVGVALAFGGTVMCMVYTVGHISGAHLNPAVTLGFASVGRFPVRQIAPYIIAQLAGAVAASATHLVTYGSQMTNEATFGATTPTTTSQIETLAMEFVLTFFLMFVIMAAASDRRVAPGVTGLAIGGAVCFGCLAAGKCCGASMNPARSLAPALFAGGRSLEVLWLYICAPVAGAIVAAHAYDWIRGPIERIDSIPDFACRGEKTDKNAK